jgi:hypothetical protein
VPADLRIKREADSLTVFSDGVVTTDVTVGKNMITGVICDPKVFRHGELLSLGGSMLQSGFLENGEYTELYRRAVNGIPRPGENYAVEVTITIFETDLPAQHFWQPRAGQLYQTLWSRTFRAETP